MIGEDLTSKKYKCPYCYNVGYAMFHGNSEIKCIECWQNLSKEDLKDIEYVSFDIKMPSKTKELIFLDDIEEEGTGTYMVSNEELWEILRIFRKDKIVIARKKLYKCNGDCTADINTEETDLMIYFNWAPYNYTIITEDKEEEYSSNYMVT